MATPQNGTVPFGPAVKEFTRPRRKAGNYGADFVAGGSGGWGFGGSGRPALPSGGNSASCLAMSSGTLPPCDTSSWAVSRSRGVSFSASKKLAPGRVPMAFHHILEAQQETSFRHLRILARILLDARRCSVYGSTLP